MPAIIATLAALSFALGCSSKQESGRHETDPAPSSVDTSRSYGMEAVFHRADATCVELVKHMLTLAEQEGEHVDASWEPIVTGHLAVCMSENYSTEEKRCLKAASSLDAYDECTATRREEARRAERRTRNPLGIPWLDSVESGIAIASKQNKKILLHFVAEWSKPGIDIEKQVLSDPRVAAVLKDRFVPVRIDVTDATDEDEALQQKLGAEVLPALLILDEAGQEITRLAYQGVPTVQEFLDLLDSVEQDSSK